MRVNKEKEIKIDGIIEKILGYCPDCGNVFWRVGRGNQYTYPGKIVDTVTTFGYLSVKAIGFEYKAHRIAWRLHTGSWPKDKIDHIDGNRTNNRILNLRESTERENSQNKRVHREGHLAGTSYCKRRKLYKSYYRIRSKQFFIGYFKTKEEANAAYLKKLSGIENT